MIAMGFTTNRDQVESEIKQGGWAVAFGRESTEEDVAKGLVAAGVSYATDNPAPFQAWLDELINESVAQLGESAAVNLVPEVRQQAIQFDTQVITQNGPIEVGAVPPEWQSAWWTIEPVGHGFAFRVRNFWKKDIFLHFQEQVLAAGPIREQWESAMWHFEAISPGIPTPTIPNIPHF
jgi:hypothetical protein